MAIVYKTLIFRSGLEIQIDGLELILSMRKNLMPLTQANWKLWASMFDSRTKMINKNIPGEVDAKKYNYI